MSEVNFFILPSDPNTDSKLTLSFQGLIPQSSILVSEWRRVFPNGTSIIIEDRSHHYQCSPLDKYCTIEARLSYLRYGSLTNRIVSSKMIKPTQELASSSSCNVEMYRCIIMVEEYKTQMMVSIEEGKLRFLSGVGQIQIPLIQNSVETGHQPNSIKINLLSLKDQFLNFYSSIFKCGIKLKNSSCVCILTSKNQCDLILSQVADNFQRQGQHLLRDSSSPSLNIFKPDIIDPKQSFIKPEDAKNNIHNTTVSTNIIQSAECLNIFEEDQLNGDNRLDQSMDLRYSFAELEKVGSRIQFQEHSSQSSSGKTITNPLQKENKILREENQILNKKIQSLENSRKQIMNLKKKYMSSVQQINRLETERRQIITEKVKYESKYHKELEDKQQLLRQLANIKTKS